MMYVFILFAHICNDSFVSVVMLWTSLLGASGFLVQFLRGPWLAVRDDRGES